MHELHSEKEKKEKEKEKANILKEGVSYKSSLYPVTITYV